MGDYQEKNDSTQAYLALTEGAKVGRYIIMRPLGSGGMGDVCLAHDTELSREVALKFLSVQLGTDVSCKARFIREAQAAAKLNHPHIVTVYEVGDYRGRPFIAMEYVSGESLKNLIGKQALPFEQALNIALQLCDGLSEAHTAGIVHRDIKPANILIDKKGHPKILDFGLAVVAGCDSLTKTGTTLGTVNYMSPEQVLGKDADSRSDIFSFGVVFYEMLSGKLPFHGDIEAVMMYAIANEPPIPLRDSLPDAPADLFHIINRLLEKSPDDRYQSTADVGTELRRLKRDTTRGLPDSARPPAITLKRFFRKLSVRLAAVAILALCAGVVFYMTYSAKPKNLRSKPVIIVPFKNQTGDASLDVLGHMIADWTTQSFQQSGLGEVIPPEALSKFDLTESIHSIAAKTGAGTIVTGSYYKIGDTIQVQSKLMDSSEKLLRAIEPVAVSSGKIMDAVESARQGIMGALAVIFDIRADALKFLLHKTPKYEAYQSYLLGRDIYFKNDGLKGTEYFDRAYRLDTLFLNPLIFSFYTYYNNNQIAQAESLLQFLNVRRGDLSRLDQRLVEGYAYELAGDRLNALSAAREEYNISPATGAFDLGRQAFNANHPREAVEAFGKISLRSNPRSSIFYWSFFADSYHALGEFGKEYAVSKQAREYYPTKYSILSREMRAFAAMGKFADIRDYISEYMELPQQENAILGRFMLLAAEELRAHGYEDSAMAIFSEAVEWYEELPAEEMKTQRFDYGIALYQTRKWEDARKIFEEFDKGLVDSFDFSRGFFGCAAARLGDREKALEISEWLKGVKGPFQFGSPTYNRACIAAILGDKDMAVALLREALSQGYAYFSVHCDMDFESLRDYPPFQELIKPKG